MAQVTPVYSPEVSPASKGWLEEHSCSSVLTGYGSGLSYINKNKNKNRETHYRDEGLLLGLLYIRVDWKSKMLLFPTESNEFWFYSQK